MNDLPGYKEKSEKRRKHKYMSFDKKRLELLSKPRKRSVQPESQRSPGPSTLLRNPDFINNLKFHFKLPNISSKIENEKYRDTLENVR